MINFKYKYIFCHNEKTAGTSMRNCLVPLGENHYISNDLTECNHSQINFTPVESYDDLPNQHMSMSRYKKLLNIDDFFTFGFVRNPMDRAFSLYMQQLKYFLDDQNISSDFIYENQDKIRLNVDERLNKSLGLDMGYYRFDFDFFIRVFLLKFGSLQYKQFCDKDKNILCKFIGRFENLQEDCNKVFDKIGVDRIKLPLKNKSNIARYTYKDFFTNDLKDFFIENYKDEFEVFGYEKG